MPINLSLGEDPEAIEDYLDDLRRLSNQLTLWISDVMRQKNIALNGWQGMAAEGFRTACDDLAKDAEDFLSSLATFMAATQNFLDTLRSVRHDFDDILATAAAVPLSVMTGSDTHGGMTAMIIEPGAPGDSHTPMTPAAQADAAREHSRRLSAYAELDGRAREFQSLHAAAHRAFRLACLELKAPAKAYVRLRPGPESLRDEEPSPSPSEVDESAAWKSREALEDRLEKLSKQADSIANPESGAVLATLKRLGVLHEGKEDIDTASTAYKDIEAQWQFDAMDPNMSDHRRLERAIFYAASRTGGETLGKKMGEKLGEGLGEATRVPGGKYLGSYLGEESGKAIYDDAYEDERANLEKLLDDLP